MMNAVANTIMLPTASNGSRMLLMTFTTATNSRRNAPPRPTTMVGGVVIHDDAPVENEVCIMNDAAPVPAAVGLPPLAPPRAR